MEHGFEKGIKMKTQCLDSDRISTLPENIIENILSLIPIKDALRTSVLSKKWRYSWRNMPKLEFTDDMVKVEETGCDCIDLEKYKIVNAIFHVLLLHNGPTVLKFNCYVGEMYMDSEFAQIFSYLSRGSNVKKIIFYSDHYSYKLPISFFLLHGLEFLQLEGSTLEPPLSFSGFCRLKSMKFINVTVSAEMLQRFLSKCPLLEQIDLYGYDPEEHDFVAGGNKFTFRDFFQCVPLIRSLDICEYYMKYLSEDDMPHKLPTSLVHLKHLFLEVCLMDQNEISSALCIIRSSPLLVKIKFTLRGFGEKHVGQTPANFLNSEDHPDLKLDHLEMLVIEWFRNLPVEMEFVKLIMATSPVLKKVRIRLHYSVSVDEEVRMLRNLVRQPLPRASPSTELIIKR